MKSIKSILVSIICMCLAYSASATSRTWTGTTSTAWATGSNWSPSGVPGSNDTIVIVSSSNNVVLSGNVTIKRIIMTSGTLDLNGDTLTINSGGDYDGGSINNGLIKPKGSLHTFAGTTFGASIDSRCAKNELNGGTYSSIVSFEDTSNSSVTSNGGCIFNSAVTIIKSGTGAGYRWHACASPNIFNSTLTIKNAGTKEIQMSTGYGTNYYHGNIIINNTGTGGIYFGTAGGGTSILDSAKTITVGADGFSAGTLLLRDFWVQSNTSQFLRLTGSAVLNCVDAYFGSPTVLNAPALALKGTMFLDSATCIHTGSIRTNSDGGNEFRGVTLMIDSGAGYFRLGCTTMDSWRENTTFKGINGRIQIGFGSGGNFEKNISITGDVSFANGVGYTILSNYYSQTLSSTDSLIRFKHLWICKSGDSVITLNHDTRVDSLLAFYKGKIISSTGAIMIFDDDAIVTGASDSAFVSGPVRKNGNDAFTFPVGKGDTYRPLTMSAPSATTDNFRAEYFNEEQMLGDSLYSASDTIDYISQCDYWNFERVTGSSNVTVSLYFKSPDCGILDSANLRIARWNGTLWNDEGAGTFTGNRAYGSLATASALTSYGNLCWAYKGPGLPSTWPIITPTAFLITRDMQPDFNGYNGANTIKKDETWFDLSLQGAAVASLQPQTLRYPAGTIGNYWNWSEGRFLLKHEITCGVAGVKVPDNYLDDNVNLTGGKDNLDNFKTSSDITGGAPIFNLNIFSSDYPYQLGSLFHAKKIALPVRYIELGNEFYNNFEAHRLVFPSVVDYATKANQWATDLKNATLSSAGVPKPQVAVVGAWQYPGADARQRVWLDNLMPLLNSDIDAVTIHQYLGTGFTSKATAPLNKSSCLSAVIGYNSFYADIPFVTVLDTINAMKNDEFKKIRDAGKKIWITECNMGGNTFVTYGSWMHALMLSLMVLGYMEEPEVHKVLPHNLVGDAERSAMFNDKTNNLDYQGGPNPDDNTCNNANHDTQPWGKSASGNALALISKAIQESTGAELIDFNVTNVSYLYDNFRPAYTNYPVLYGWKFTKDNTEEYIILNLSEIGYGINMSSLSSLSSGYYETLYAPYSNYITGDPGISQNQPPVYHGKIALDATLTIPSSSYSVTRVVFYKPGCSVKLVATEDKLCTGTTTTLIAYNQDLSKLTWIVDPLLPYAHTVLANTIIISPAAGFTTPGTYTVSVSNAACTTSVDIMVNEPPSLTAALTAGSNSICPPSGTATLTATCGTCTDYIWTPSYGLTSSCASATNPAPFCNVVTVSPEQTTDYIVYATDGVCWTSASAITITSEKPEISDIAGPILKCNTGNAVPLSITSTAATYEWTPSTGLSQTTGSSVTTGVTSNIIYTVTANPGGCTASSTISVKVAQNCCTTVTANDVVLYNNTSGSSSSNVDNLIGLCTSYFIHSLNATTNINEITHGAGTGTLYINGVFYVDQNLGFTNCTIQFGEQAEVHVDKDITLKFIGCTISACSAWTWRSIYASEGATVIVEDDAGTKTKIYDADTALNLSSGADYNVINSEFINNYTGIHLYDYAQKVNSNNTMGNIYGNKFHASSLKTKPGGGNLAYGLSGITLKYCQEIPIGEIGSTKQNEFYDLALGVRSLNSESVLLNNKFHSMRTLGIPMMTNVGVYAKSASDYYDRNIQIGNTYASGANVFYNSNYGINCDGEQNITIDKNEFGVTQKLNVAGIAIYSNSKQIELAHNEYEDFHLGAFLWDIKSSSTVSIHDETFTDADLTNATSFYGTAILMQNPVPQNPDIRIYGNTIDNPRIGMFASQFEGITIGIDDFGSTAANKIDFYLSTAPSVYRAGVWLQNCNDAHIVGSTDPTQDPPTNTPDIENSTNLGITNADKFRAIDIESSENCRINCNYIKNIPWSIRFMDHCGLTKMKDNYMENYEHGVHIEAGTILPIIVGDWDATNSDYIPYDNRWVYNSATKKIWNDAGGLDWYHQGNSTSKYYPLPAFGLVNAKPTNLTGDNDCQNFARYANRNASIGRAVYDSLEFEENVNANIYRAKFNAFIAMKKDSALIEQGAEDDGVYQDFMTGMQSSNMGIFASIDSVLRITNDTAAALALLVMVDDTNDIETALKTVYNIYLHTLAVGLPLSGSDSTILEGIANTPVAEKGIAAYMAAAMLGLEIHQEPASHGSRYMQPTSLVKTKEILTELVVYPNPTDGRLHITGLGNESASIEIYDMKGQLLLAKKNVIDNDAILINKLSNGIYRLNIFMNKDNHYQVKFSVLK